MLSISLPSICIFHWKEMHYANKCQYCWPFQLEKNINFYITVEPAELVYIMAVLMKRASIVIILCVGLLMVQRTISEQH